MLQYTPFVALFLTIVGAAIRYERRLTTIETLLRNHLAHHEGFESKLSSLLEAMVKKV